MRRHFAIAVASIARSLCFTEHSPILQSEASARGYERNMWVEERVADRYGIRSGERSITVVVPKMLELVNLSQVTFQDRASKLYKTEPVGHTSIVTSKPYTGQFSMKLDEEATERHFTSKWWLPPSKLSELKLTLGEQQRPVKVFMQAKSILYNVTQLQAPDAIDYVPISPITGNFYRSGTAMYDSMVKFNRDLGVRSALMFTSQQLAGYRLTTKPGAKGLSTAIVDPLSRFTLYCVEDLEDYENILASLNRTVLPPEPRLLMSGTTLVQDNEKFANRTNKYVVNGREAAQNEWKIKKDATPVVTSKYSELITFSVAQLEDPAKGYAVTMTKPQR